MLVMELGEREYDGASVARCVWLDIDKYATAHVPHDQLQLVTTDGVGGGATREIDDPS